MPFVKGDQSAKGRRVLAMIDHYPTAEEMAKRIIKKEWPYSPENKEYYEARDRALASLLFIGAIRISEARRLIKSQFKEDPFRVIGLKLSKAERHNKKGEIIVRKKLYRVEILIPESEPLGIFGEYIHTYLDKIENEDAKLFPIKNSRIDQIIKTKLGIPPHWLRAFGENLLYELFENDLIAAANYVQVDPRTFSLYVHRTPKRYLEKLK
jgi:integrase